MHIICSHCSTEYDIDLDASIANNAKFKCSHCELSGELVQGNSLIPNKYKLIPSSVDLGSKVTESKVVSHNSTATISTHRIETPIDYSTESNRLIKEEQEALFKVKPDSQFGIDTKKTEAIHQRIQSIEDNLKKHTAAIQSTVVSPALQPSPALGATGLVQESSVFSTESTHSLPQGQSNKVASTQASSGKSYYQFIMLLLLFILIGVVYVATQRLPNPTSELSKGVGFVSGFTIQEFKVLEGVNSPRPKLQVALGHQLNKPVNISTLPNLIITGLDSDNKVVFTEVIDYTNINFIENGLTSVSFTYTVSSSTDNVQKIKLNLN